MSATNRGKIRQQLEQYYTPPELANALVDLLQIQPGDTVLEPHVGRGAYASAALRAGARVAAMDLDPKAPGLQLEGLDDAIAGVDFLSVDVDSLGFDWVLGNPPYSIEVGRSETGGVIRREIATAHITHGLRALRPGGTLAYLLRVNLQGSGGKARKAFWESSGLRFIYNLCERPSFTGGGTDSTEYAWYVFEKGHTDEPITRWISWKVGK